MSTQRKKRAKVENEEEVMDIDVEPSKEELQKKGTQLYWELEDLMTRYKEMTGNDFVPGEREIEGLKHDVKVLHHGFSCHYERIADEVDENDLRPLDEACIGCGTRTMNRKTFSETSTLCSNCKKKVSTKTDVGSACKGIPQLKNQCGPVWTSGIQLASCRRCLLHRLGRTDIDNSPPPLSTQGGFARFQDLSQIDLKTLLGDSETGAVLCRVMNFSVQNERVFANILLKYHRDDVRLKTATGLRQLMYEGSLSIMNEVKTKSKDVKFGFVKVEERHIPWAPEHKGWTPTAACANNDFCFGDIVAAPHLESMEGQGIKTRIVNLSFTMNQNHVYLSLSGVKFHSANRGITIEWVPAEDAQMSNKEGNTGEIYLEGMELEDGIYIYVGSTGSERHHQKNSRTAYVEYKTAHSSARMFKTTLYYPPNKDDLRLHESQFMIGFLLAQLHGCQFKNFSPPFPNTTTFTNCSSLDEFSTDKLIKVMNNNIIGKNYSLDQFNQIGNFSSVLFKWKAEITYDWDKDQLKYVKPPLCNDF